ncbi:immunity 53 family protein [Candidatus Soleaferrea massiliensis]|uniref:immunity 53 family protein n=1 Tax=Candidatus Soleaferrea massiliensis TaxID=1470354 RepID=UPI00058D298D|nr:immunity 53 family protein [Candidatus Soleaferrea massiliensis]
MNRIKWLEKWYQRNCNGEWEHFYGIEIGTLDNPGWYVKIDLAETKHGDLQMNEINIDRGENDWMRCSVENGIFQGYGDCTKLDDIIQTFMNWADPINSINEETI